MLIRKNTKAFKTIREIITASQDRPDRDKLIRLYITRAGHSINDRISVESIEGDSTLFYEMNYHAILGNLESSSRQLHQSDDIPGIYFFRSTSNKAWDETPFEFDVAIKKEFASLPELPAVRKKEKSAKFVLPPPNKHSASKQKPPKKGKAEKKKIEKVTEKEARQPNYKLKHKIHFTDLDEVVFKKPQLTKKDVLEYYNNVADYILPYLKDRPLSVRSLSKTGRPIEYQTTEAFADRVQLPDWLRTLPSKKEEGRLLLCNDRNHLLFYVEVGCVEFATGLARSKSLDIPDYLIIKIESPRDEFDKALAVAIIAKEILFGLQLPCFIKTDGQYGLHVYVMLDAKSKFEKSNSVAEYICKLIRLKRPDLVAVAESDELSYGKIMLDYSFNKASGRLVAPYSLVIGESVSVATPLLWEEVVEDPTQENFTHETIFKRLNQKSDPLEKMFKKKLNAEDLLERMKRNYSFLF